MTTNITGSATSRDGVVEGEEDDGTKGQRRGLQSWIGRSGEDEGRGTRERERATPPMKLKLGSNTCVDLVHCSLFTVHSPTMT